MTGHDAEPKSAAQLLLDAYEEIKGEQCHPEDQLEAQRLARLPLPMGTIIARMRAVAQRNGPTWRPSRLRYFANPVADLVKDRPVVGVVQPTGLKDNEESLSQEEHEQALAHLRSLQTPEQRRRVEVVQTLVPRASILELKHLLIEGADPREFAKRLEECRQRRRSTEVAS